MEFRFFMAFMFISCGLSHALPQFNWNTTVIHRGENQPTWNPQNPFLPIPPVTGSSTTVRNEPTTASPQYLLCMQRCPSTMEYNPICGSDGVNYHNNGRLQCAVQCGRDVSTVRSGVCAPL